MYNGNKKIKLSRTYMLSSGEVSELSMREPLVSDQLAAQETQKGNAAKGELQLCANLCGLAYDDMLKLAGCDWRKVREALEGFLDPAESGANTQS